MAEAENRFSFEHRSIDELKKLLDRANSNREKIIQDRYLGETQKPVNPFRSRGFYGLVNFHTRITNEIKLREIAVWESLQDEKGWWTGFKARVEKKQGPMIPESHISPEA